MTQQTFRRALVTGASAGIGAAIATRLAAHGTDLVLVARRADALDELAARLSSLHGITATTLVADLTDADDLDAVGQRLDAAPHVDLVVNNAGYGTVGPIVSSSLDAEVGQVSLNMTALTLLSIRAANVFRDRGKGGILNVSSMAAWTPAANNATYSASKAYVSSFTEALHEELRATGVHVTCLAPGFTRMEFHAASDWTVGEIPNAAWMSAEAVAEAAVAAVQANRAVCVPGVANKVVTGMARVLPAGISRRVTGLVANRLG